MDWNDLRYILAVAREGTLLGGGRALRVSPTTVSRRLRALEQDHGTALFDKLKHGAVLSEAGERVVAVAEQVEHLTAQLDAEIQGMDARLQGTIRVTATDMLLKLWMRDFGAFRQRYPEVDLELMSTMQVVNLTQREADVALRIAPSAPDHLLGARHAEVHYAVYGSPELVQSAGCDATYADYPWLSWDHPQARSTDAWIREHAGPDAVVLRFDDMPVMEQAIEDGLGLTILPCLIGDRSERMQRVGDYFEGGLFLWVLTHPQLRATARISAFRRFVRELVQRDRDLIEGRLPRTTE